MTRKGRTPQRGLELRDCTVCGSRFQPYRDAAITCSKPCYRRLPHVALAAKTYRAQPEIRDRKNAARRVIENPHRRDVNLRQNLRRYGVTVEWFEAKRTQQMNRCEICGESPDPAGVRAASRLHVDHDHVTGDVRDLLCGRCNQGIGYFKDDPALFHAAAAYIERHRQQKE
ncbi:MAG TPA: endonuclease domain-containing protein [Kribbellaceae bacterium]|nr:endonuclease domain-containing protein [Kribbellaceae bacterium]